MLRRIDYKLSQYMIPQQSGKIKFCVMKFANIFLMGKLNPQNFF